jgi:hypothetical protein
MTAPNTLTTSYASLVNRIGLEQFGLLYNGTPGGNGSADVVSNNQANSQTTALIGQALNDGLRQVYSAYRWSFLRPSISIATIAAYTTGTIFVDASGNVALAGGTFPSYAASQGGQLWIQPTPAYLTGGAFAVASYVDGAHLTLTSYTGPAVPGTTQTGSTGSTNSAPGTTFSFGATLSPAATIGQYVIVYSGSGATVGVYQIVGGNLTTNVVLATSPGASLSSVHWGLTNIGAGNAYALSFNVYPLPAGVDTLQGTFTYPPSPYQPAIPLERVNEVEIRRMLSCDNLPGRPLKYALTTSSTVGASASVPASTRYASFWPIPGAAWTLTAVGVVREVGLDPVNFPYPIGDEVLAPVLTEACLAAAQLICDQIDASHPAGIHARKLPALLAAAVVRDKEYASPDSLGIEHGGEGDEYHRWRHYPPINWNAGGGYVGPLG